MILFLHHRYRTTGGEEQAVDNLMWLVREHLGEDAEVLQRDSAAVRGLPAAAGMLWGGLHPDEVARAVRHTRARVVHAHNLHPTYGWRALAAARGAGAAIVLHLHQYRMVCAIGVCFRDGHECTRCHGRNTLPGVLLNCRGGSAGEAIAYGAGLALWQRRIAAHVDTFVVPSRFAQARLRDLGAPVAASIVLRHPMRELAAEPTATPGGHALITSRLVPEKGIEVAIKACRIAGVPLVVAGDGPERDRLARHRDHSELWREQSHRHAQDVTFVGQVPPSQLPQLRRGAALALVPSLVAENLPMAAAEAMAAGLPVAGSRVGGLPELVPEIWLATPGDATELAAVITGITADRTAGARALARAREVTSPEVIAPALAAVYERAESQRSRTAG
ncbi:MAG TPA: glycosyltransferase family 4 protein [Solirubrobacteraceae bacterium]|nr:glycosyltransferase family 4 protein [Solirubrobacteraceae bacterium]